MSSRAFGVSFPNPGLLKYSLSEGDSFNAVACIQANERVERAVCIFHGPQKIGDMAQV